MTKQQIAVLSDGAWGTALAIHLVRKGHDVTQWGPFPDYLEEMAKTRANPRFLAGVELPAELRHEPNMAEAIRHANLILLATPLAYLRQVLENLATVQPSPAVPILNVAKGIEVKTLKRVSEIVAEYLPRNPYAVLSGPSHAEEVARQQICAVTAASSDPAVSEMIQQTFSNSVFRVYTSRDVAGVELGGALKNVFAIAAGICDGLGMGDNPKAALITRSVAEMTRLGMALGGELTTFSGLSGLGDLIVTCTSRHSRNRYVGEQLGRGLELKAILKSMGMVVAEGVLTAESAHELGIKYDVRTPVIDQVYAVLYQDLPARQAVTRLMERDPGPEFDFVTQTQSQHCAKDG
ncbi:MAG: NAD(P)-dependent glycerol-3-phosphate dehydrogenase [Lentisphaerae bacterium]|nr:MAG: NAD(P)-dependent glycerol-3-phosphate dehydrogenase [Lentisphaerota bacterium]